MTIELTILKDLTDWDGMGIKKPKTKNITEVKRIILLADIVYVEETESGCNVKVQEGDEFKELNCANTYAEIAEQFTSFHIGEITDKE